MVSLRQTFDRRSGGLAGQQEAENARGGAAEWACQRDASCLETLRQAIRQREHPGLDLGQTDLEQQIDRRAQRGDAHVIGGSRLEAWG